jgi:predicted outer membrane repeat protein
MNDSEEIRSNHYTWNTPGLGTIRTSHQNINFQGHNNFERNWGTALYVVNAIVNFQKSSASFVNNIGLQGGAVALVGSSTLIVGPHDYVFHNNSAYYQGGAIYVLLIDHFDIEVSQSCFIEYADDVGDVEIDNIIDHTDNEWKANITFTDNHILRGMAGCTIFATSLYSCQVINNGTKDQPEYVILHPNVALERRGLKINDHDFNCTHQVATDGAKFHIGSATPLMIIPGKEYSHNITATDDLGQDIHNVPFRMVIHDPDDTTYLLFNNVTSSTTYIEDEIQLMGNPDQTEHAVLRLHTLSARQIFIEANITLVECPPGFVLVNESRPRCVCNEKAPVGIFNCNLKEFRSHLLPGYWAGLLEGELVTSTCPFCEYDNKFMSKSEFDITLPQSYSELNKAICGNRNGTVCGICQNNYTVHFHSPNFKCKSKKPVGCKLGWLFYILSEIVPVTVVFIIVLVFNISFTSGTISGFILFSQLLVTLDINASGIIKFSYPLKHNLNDWEEGYLMLYGVFNLDFFNSERLSFCIMTNASALDMIAFKYVTILYTLLLILSVIWIMNKCGGRCCGRVCRITTVRSSVVQGLSSFLVMCYTRCVQVSMNLLNPVHLKVERDSLFNPLTRVWLNGDMIYFSEAHLRYAFPALFCLFTIGVLPPVLLLCYPLLNKVPAFFGCNDINVDCLFCHKVSVSYLKPLLDSFQSCFRDNMRFFAGLYFLYRWIILLVYVVTHSYSIYYITIIGGLVGILALHAICQPYVKRSHNIIDILLLANLIIISCLSFYNYHRNHYLRGVKHSTTAPAAIVQLVLIYLPLIALCTYILMIACKMVKKRKKIVFSASDKLVPRRANRLREFIRTISDENDDSDEVELTHDQLMDEDVSFDENVCNYFKASGDTEMVLLKT